LWDPRKATTETGGNGIAGFPAKIKKPRIRGETVGERFCKNSGKNINENADEKFKDKSMVMCSKW
jgi:hypothetical protein